MFLVTCESALDERWEERDALILRAAGRPSAGNCASCERRGGVALTAREHLWLATTFDEARALRARLGAVPGVRATIREQ